MKLSSIHFQRERSVISQLYIVGKCHDKLSKVALENTANGKVCSAKNLEMIQTHPKTAPLVRDPD